MELGLTKSKFFKKLTAGVAAVAVSASALAFADLPVNRVSAAVASYTLGGKTISISQILTDFQFFVGGNANLNKHFVGSIAVGGNVNMGEGGGQGAFVPSYVGNYVSGGYGGDSYFKSKLLMSADDDLQDKNLYYTTSVSELSSSAAVTYTQVGAAEYIDMATAMNTICSESSVLAAAGTTVTASNVSGTTVTVPISDTTRSFTVPYSVLPEGDVTINFTSSELTTPAQILDFLSNGFTLSLTGVDNNNIGLDTAWGGVSGDGFKMVSIRFNGDVLPNAMQTYANAGGQDIELYAKGFAYMINLPDATGTVYINHSTNHTVAPKAAVMVSSAGAAEGNVIAASVISSGSEQHYYPYNNILPSSDPTTNFSFNKVIAGTTNSLAGATFALYDTQENAAAKIATGRKATAISDVATTGNVSFTSVSYSTSEVTTYYMVETAAPANYTADNTVYTVSISTTGVVTYTSAIVASPTDIANLSVGNQAAPATPSDIQIIKEYKLNGENQTNISEDERSKTTFTLYEVTDKSTGAVNATPTASAVPIGVGSPVSGYKVTFTSTNGIACNKMYKIVETATGEYTAQAATWFANIAATGVVTYGATSNGEFKSDLPTFTNTKNTTTAINLIKTYTSPQLSTAELIDGTEFTLYSDSNCTTAVETKKPTWSGTQATVTFTVTCPTTTTVYYLKETAAPFGYNMSKNVYECKVEADGNVTYKIEGTADDYSTEFPSCKNEKQIVLVKKYGNEYISTDEILNNTEFTLYQTYNGTTFGAVKGTSTPVWNAAKDQAIVSFKDLIAPVSGEVTYYLKETKSHSSYKCSDNVYECVVDSDGNVKYKLYGSADELSETFPICNNLLVSDPVPTTTTPNGGSGSEITTTTPNGGSGSGTTTTPNGGSSGTTTTTNNDNSNGTTTTTNNDNSNGTTTTTNNDNGSETTTTANGDDADGTTTLNGGDETVTTVNGDDYDNGDDDDIIINDDDESDDDDDIFSQDGGSNTGTGTGRGDDNPLTGVGIASSLAIIVLTSSGTIAALTRKKKK